MIELTSLRGVRGTYALFAAAVSLGLSACGGSATKATEPIVPTPPKTDTAAPPIAREMRGLWIATVANIDWPSKTGLNADQQRAELTDILDKAASLGLNAIMFHIRPAADAVYDSALEPWAALLSGTQGTPPGYDPLAFAITEAHARGMELHAWINPFRAGNTADSAKLAPTHSFKVRRDVVRVYGSQLWLDPGEPSVQDHSMRVVSDIVSRYEIDAIHADDYFYPYQEVVAGKVLDFPDSGSYARSGSTLSRADWRRNNIDRFVERMYGEVHKLKPMVKVGLSPFGIWRPGFPTGVNGLDAFATIYADSRKWLQEGWVDYLAPQLYWAISAPQQSFPSLLDWWATQSTKGRHVWPGLATYRVNDGTTSAFNSAEIPAQIQASRTRLTNDGHILYNTTTTLKKSSGAVAQSIASLYPTPALVPASPWLDSSSPAVPTVTVSGRTAQLTPGAGTAVRWWHIRSRAGGVWTTKILFGDQRTITFTSEPDRVIVNAVSMAGNASGDRNWVKP